MRTRHTARPIGLLDITATIAVMGSIVWAAARGARDRHRKAIETARRDGYLAGYTTGVLDRYGEPQKT